MKRIASVWRGPWRRWLAAAPAVAQEQRASIEGTVEDSSGGVLPGVTVEARSPVAGRRAEHGDRPDGHLPVSGAARPAATR